MNRGLAGQAVYLSDGHRQLFIGALVDATSVFQAECHAYCLMDNHYHLLLHTPLGNLSRVMRHINGVYTQRFNRDVKRDGPLFRGRYKAILVDADAYLLQLSRYIHRNPLEAGLVEHIGPYQWSSYNAYIGKADAPTWLHCEKVLGMIGQRNQADGYRHFVEQGVDHEIQDFYSKNKQLPILGSDNFIAALNETLASEETWEEVPERKALRAQPTVEAVIKLVASAYQLAPDMLLMDGRKGNAEPRMVAMALSRLEGGHSLTEIAQVFNVKYVSVSSGIIRYKRKCRENRDLEQKTKLIRRQLYET